MCVMCVCVFLIEQMFSILKVSALIPSRQTLQLLMKCLQLMNPKAQLQNKMLGMA